MPSPLPGSDDDVDEEKLRTEVHIAIDRALSDVLGPSERKRFLTNTEGEKLTFFSIKHLGLPLTYSWYLLGANTQVGPDPDAHTDWEPSDTVAGLEVQRGSENPRIRTLREYFRSAEFMDGYTLRDIWFTDKFEFLRDFYESEAPSEFRELYLHSLDLREHLSDIEKTVDRDSENESLSNWVDGASNTVIASETEQEIRYLVSDVHMDLAANEELNQTKKLVSQGTNLLERVISKLTRLESTTEQQRRYVSGLSEFFYYYVWKYPALLISANTAEGPNASALERRHRSEFEDFDEALRTQIRQRKYWFRDSELLPEAGEHIADDTEKTAFLNTMLKDTVDNR